MHIKKIIFLFILISISLFPKNITFFISDKENHPISEAYVSFNDVIKKTNNLGLVSFDTIENKGNILIEKTGFNTYAEAININSSDNFKIILNQNYKYFMNLFEGTEFDYSFDKEPSTDFGLIKDAVINIYKNQIFYKSVNFSNKEILFDIEDGIYTFVIYIQGEKPFIIENVFFSSKNKSYFNIFIPLKLSKINGIVKSDEALIGKAKITLNGLNGTIEAFSDIEGNFSLTVPNGFYKITINKTGYKEVSQEINIEGKSNSLSYNLEEIPSIIKGRILNSKGQGIKNEGFYIKNKEKDIFVKTDNNGFYEASVYSGLAFLKINILGYFPTGRVEKVDSFSSKTIDNIILTEKIGSISGTITNAVIPIPNSTVKLYDFKGNYYASTKSDSKGFFSLDNIRSDIEYFIEIENSNYFKYKSPSFIISNGKNKNFTIILKNHNANFILEIKTNKNISLKNIEVFINKNKFLLDSNGMINDSIQSDKKVDSLLIEIPSLGVNQVYKIEDLGKEPYLITINF